MLNDLVKQYETLWETNAPIEQIAKFCRQHLGLIAIDDSNKKWPELLQILCQSTKWGEWILQPVFLKALQENDNKLLAVILYYFNNCFMVEKYDDIKDISHHRLQYVQIILSLKDTLPEKIRAIFWATVAKGIWEQTGMLFNEDSTSVYQNYAPNACQDMSVIDNETIYRLIQNGNYKYPPRQIPIEVHFSTSTDEALSKQFFEAIDNDSVPLFDMNWSIMVLTVTHSLLATALKAMIEHKAFNLIAYFLEKHRQKIKRVCDPVELLTYLCQKYPNSSDILPIVEVLLKKFPNIDSTASSLSAYNTPLWHCLHFFPSDYAKQTDILAQTLIQHGCNPNACSHIGLSYNSCKKAIKLLEIMDFYC